jgi:hypothetical protein
MITMVVIAAAGLMLTFTLLRRTASRTRRGQDGIRWRGIDWSRGVDEEPEEAGQFKNGQD